MEKSSLLSGCWVVYHIMSKGARDKDGFFFFFFSGCVNTYGP